MDRNFKIGEDVSNENTAKKSENGFKNGFSSSPFKRLIGGKQRKVYFSTFTAIFAVIATMLIFYSCQKKVGREVCELTTPNAIEQVSINLMNKSFKADFNIVQSVRNGIYRESVYPNEMKESIFQFFKDYCINKNLLINNQTMALIIYYDTLITQYPNIIDKNIRGISVYNIENNKIIHHLFVKNEQEDFYEIENVKVAVPAVTGNHVRFYLENYVFTDINNKSSISLMGNLSVDVYKNINKYKTPMKFELKKRKDIVALTKGCADADGCRVGAANMYCLWTFF